MKVPLKYDSKTESAANVTHPIVLQIEPNIPLPDIAEMLTAIFGPSVMETDLPENKPFMDAACDHWRVNNTDEERDPALEIEYKMERFEVFFERGE